MRKRFLFLFFLLLIVYILNAFANFFPKRNVILGFRPQYGVSWSFEQAGWYGLDSRKSYIELLDAVRFDFVRLAYFWSDNNIEDLEFGIKEAQKRNINVVVAIGAKTPYFPEYHLPSEIESQINFGETIGVGHPVADEIIAADREVIKKLSKYKNITHWQVENEPFLPNYRGVRIGEDLLRVEVETVKALDLLKRPVILSSVGPAVFDSSWKKLLPLMASGDVLGVNAYFKTQGTTLLSYKLFEREVNIPWPKELVWPVQSWFGFSPNYKNIKEKIGQENNLWVMEMQAEPYIRVREDADRVKFFYTPLDIVKADEFLKSSRVEYVGLWGAPFWMYRYSIGDSSWIDSVRGIIN